MFKCDRSDEKNIKARRVSYPPGRRFCSAQAVMSASVDPTKRKTRSERQIGMRFANHLAKQSYDGDFLMTYKAAGSSNFWGRIASIPLNAASLGGLLSFLLMLGAWGRHVRRMLTMWFSTRGRARRSAEA